MASILTDIADRLTPSAPIEITYGSQPVAVGQKVTTLLAHMATSPGTGMPYEAFDIVNVGDPVQAQEEVDGYAGQGSQAGQMAYAFVAANALAQRSNFPAFRVILIPKNVNNFGPNGEALATAQTLRNDMMVSCYAAGDQPNRTLLLNLANQISGVDRDLNGQFGSFVTLGSTDALATALNYGVNSRVAILAYMQDTNQAAVTTNGVLSNGSPLVSGIAPLGVYPGATATATGIPAGTTVLSVAGNAVTLSNNATADETSGPIVFQNQVSQPAEIIAAAHAGGMMASLEPYNPLQGVVIGGLLPPQKRADRILIDPSGNSEACLKAGLSPLTVQAGGNVAFIRTRISLVFATDGVTRLTDYIDWQSVVALYDFREVIYQITQNPPFNANPGGAKASASLLAKFKDEVLREANEFEKVGMFQNVKTLAKYFLTDIPSPGRFDIKVPVNVVPGLYVLAANIEAISDITEFTV